MVPVLSHFPSVCLEAICKYIPLEDLFRYLGRVCTSFQASGHTDLSRRRRLVILQMGHPLEQDYGTLTMRHFLFSPYGNSFIEMVRREDGSPWFTVDSLKQYQFDALSLPHAFWTGPVTAPSPIDQLPHITQLVLILVHDNTALPQLVRIIGHYTRGLQDLKLKIDIFADYPPDGQLAVDWASLFACLNGLESIEHMRLELSRLPPIRPELTFLARLRTFAIHVGYPDHVGWIVGQLGAHYTGEGGTIELRNTVLSVRDFLDQVNERLDSNFRSLGVSFDIDFDSREDVYDTLVQDFGRFCARFRELTILSLDQCPMPITLLARHLSQLNQLVQLYLTSRVMPGERQQLEEPEHRIVPVPSLLLLLLTIYTRSHHDTERLSIPLIFPNLQVLRLWHEVCECAECGLPNYGYMCLEPEDQIDECKRLARLAFWHCPQLHTIQPDPTSPLLITASEL